MAPTILILEPSALFHLDNILSAHLCHRRVKVAAPYLVMLEAWIDVIIVLCENSDATCKVLFDAEVSYRFVEEF
jgi:hypothetical protein